MVDRDRFNAAQRLLEIIEELLKIPGNTPIWQAYLQVWGHGETKTDAMFFAYNLAMLADEIERTIITSENVEDRLLNTLNPLLNHCHSLNIDTPLSTILSVFNEVRVSALSMFSVFFTNVCSEKKISKEEHLKLSESVQELFDEVDNIDHNEIREILLSIVECARRAIHLYYVNGSKPFAHVFELALGKLTIQYTRENFSNSPDKTLADKVFAFTNSLVQVANRCNTMLALPSNIAGVVKAIGL